QVVEVVDTNVRAENGDAEAFIDLVAVGAEYPLFGTVSATGLPEQTSIFNALERQDEQFGALVSPLLLDALDLSIGDTFRLAGTALEVRGTLLELPDAIARGFRLGVPVLVTTDAFSSLSDRTSPLPGLGNWFRYKLRADGDADAIRASLDRSFTPEGWTV